MNTVAPPPKRRTSREALPLRVSRHLKGQKLTRTTRRNFSNSDKTAMNRRATDASGQLRCEGCGLALKQSEAEYDHIIPEALRPDADKLKPVTIAEGQVLGRDCCHRGEGSKTSRDMGKIAKAKRVEAKAAYVGKQPTLKGRAFTTTPKAARRKKQAKNKLPVPKPKNIYQEASNP